MWLPPPCHLPLLTPPSFDSLQWSKGEYLDANNKEDDITVMTENGMPLRADDHGDSLEGATLVTDGVTVPDTTTTLRCACWLLLQPECFPTLPQCCCLPMAPRPLMHWH